MVALRNYCAVHCWVGLRVAAMWTTLREPPSSSSVVSRLAMVASTGASKHYAIDIGWTSWPTDHIQWACS